MKKVCFFFFGISVLSIFFSDISVSTISPGKELLLFGKGFLTPNFSLIFDIKRSVLNTITFAICGTFIGVIFGAVFSFLYHYPFIRLFCTFIRSIHEIFWAFLLLPIFGLNAVCGVLAIAIPYTGVFAKVYYEIHQESDHRPLDGFPHDTFILDKFFYGILPVIYFNLKTYTSYRFECALRSSAILGFIGLPTLGYHLESYFRVGSYSETAAILIFFYGLIILAKKIGKPWAMPFFVIGSFLSLSWDISYSKDNILRFFTREIIPWPLRKDGVFSGTNELNWDISSLFSWLGDIFQNEVIEGIWNTLLITQVSVLITAIIALLAIVGASHHFSNPIGTRISHVILVIVRTTPEYLLAFLAVVILGPSMLPAILALSLHNGAIVGYLNSNNADLIRLPLDSSRKKWNRYFYQITPQIFGQFLAFLFYRWEIMVRESAILGILGIYTLGFYIDSAVSEDKLDKALVLIIFTALLNMGIDYVSKTMRGKMNISAAQKIE